LSTIKPKKSLGQNFLIDQNIARKIVNSLDIKEGDFVIEIGPGEGALTKEIIALPANVIAIEIDERACAELERKFPTAEFPNFKLVQQDFMESDILSLFDNKATDRKIKIIGNLPYYISSRIIYKVIENADKIDKAVFMLQKEVAGRLAAKPGNKTYGILSVAISFTGSIKKLFDVPPQCFFPKPKVTSTVFELNFRDSFDKELFDNVMKIVKLAFNQRRKKLSNALSSIVNKNDFFESENLNFAILDKRAEDLSFEDYISLSKLIYK
jgi:16S rRNA (adenine1518-N6/adenine1519-N6)-dimethyltransferase